MNKSESLRKLRRDIAKLLMDELQIGRLQATEITNKIWWLCAEAGLQYKPDGQRSVKNGGR